jgi:hypothetical protein
LWTAAPIDNKCDTDPNNRCTGDEWIEVWSLLHRVKEVTHADNTYTVTVEPSGKGFQFVYIHRLNPKAALRFVRPEGTVLETWDEAAPPDKVNK